MLNLARRRLSGIRFLSAAALLALSSPVVAQGWVVAEGGGMGDSPAYQAQVVTLMVEKAREGARNRALGTGEEKAKENREGRGEHGARRPEGPRVVILGAVPLEGKDERAEAFRAAGASEVASLVVDEKNADAPGTYDAIARADVVFIRGGDQGRYVKWWRGRRTEAAIRAVFDRGGVVGGTSAGCAVLGEWTYDAIRDGLSADEALTDARHTNLTLTHGFLGFVPGVLFDTHYTERGRLPRTMVMLARIAVARGGAWRGDLGEDIQIGPELLLQDRERLGRGPLTPDRWAPIGIGVDTRTAVVVGPDHVARVVGEGTVTVLRLLPTSEMVIEKGRPPRIKDVGLMRLSAGYAITLPTLEITNRAEGVLHPRALGSRPGPGPDDAKREPMAPGAEAARAGEWYPRDAVRQPRNRDGGTDAPSARASLAAGEGKLPGYWATGMWKELDPWSAMALGWEAMASRRAMRAAWAPAGAKLEAGRGGFRNGAEATQSVLVVEMGFTSPSHVAGAGPRGVSVVEEAVGHLVGPGGEYGN